MKDFVKGVGNYEARYTEKYIDSSPQPIGPVSYFRVPEEQVPKMPHNWQEDGYSP
jgi:hypothetical protein